MHELEIKLQQIDMLKTNILNCLNRETSCEIGDQNVQQIGLVVDMFKDLVDAEKNCAEACYYKTVIKAMKENDGDSIESEGRYGYDHYRYASGRFAPKGKGHYSGYTPTSQMPPYIHDISQMYEDGMVERMGYDSSGRGNRSQSGTNMSSGVNRGSSRYGYNYDRYDEARKHFDETKDPKWKDEMNQEAMYHIKGFKESIKDMWNSSDPELRQKLKSEMSAIVSELK